MTARTYQQIGLALAVAAAFAVGLAAPFHFDDWADVVANPAASPEHFFERLGATVRPLLKASYALNAWLLGPGPLGYHAVNLGLHVAAALLVFQLVRGWAPGLALLTAALWALHPIAVESVAYVSGRSALLSGVLMLGALALATRDRPSLAAGLLAFLAPLARETALVLPLLLAWWQMTLGAGQPRPWRRAAPVWLGTLAAVLVLAAMPRHRDLLGFSLEARAPLAALRGNLHAIVEMLAFWPMPWRISIDPAQPLVWDWLAWQSLVKAGALLAATTGAVMLRRSRPLIAFAIGWTLLCLAPTNSLVWRLDPVGLRPLYLATLGLALLLAALLMRVERRGVVALALAGALAMATVDRAAVYRSPVAVWQDAVDKAPGNARALVALGQAQLSAGRIGEAEAAFQAALDRAPWLVAARHGLDLVMLAKISGRS